MLIRGDLARSLDQEFSAGNMNRGRQSADSCCELEECCACCHAFVKTEEGNLSDEGEREQAADERSGACRCNVRAGTDA